MVALRKHDSPRLVEAHDARLRVDDHGQGAGELQHRGLILFHEQHAMMLGVMLGCTGVTQLLGPAIGYSSDRSTSPHGRRRPMMVVGAVIACIGCVAMRVTREMLLRYAYLGALTITLAGLNIMYALL